MSMLFTLLRKAVWLLFAALYAFSGTVSSPAAVRGAELLPDFSYKGSLKMDRTVTKITGGDLLGDVLFLSSNSSGAEKITYSVDLCTGETKEAFVRDTGNAATEAEGLAIRQEGDAAYFHYLDVPVASRTIIRSYRLMNP